MVDITHVINGTITTNKHINREYRKIDKIGDNVLLYRGDCLEKMSEIADASVDMVLCDLPYGTTACKWDEVVDFGQLWMQYDRVVKDNGAIVLFGSEPFSSKLRLSKIEMFKYDWVWRKPKGTGHLNAKRQPMRDVEYISVFYRKQCMYNPQFSAGEPYGNKQGQAFKVNESGETTYGKFADGPGTRSKNHGTRYPKQCIEFGVVERGTVHPTQKPVPLLEYLIKTYTEKGETVLDNTMGSGSTGVACVNTGRKFIGIELDEKYYRISKKRIEEALHMVCE